MDLGSSLDSFKNKTKSDRSDDERSVTPTPTTTTKVKQATRLPSNDQSTSRASDSDTDSVELYNETDPVAKSQAVSSLVAGTPIVQLNETARDQNNTAGTQAIQRSEDIHPTPPTIPPGQTNSQAQPSKSDTNSDESTASDDDDDNEKPAVATGRDAAADIPGGRGAPSPAAITTNSRDAAGQSSLVTMARTTAESGGGRQPGPNSKYNFNLFL
mgnify:FL=1